MRAILRSLFLTILMGAPSIFMSPLVSAEEPFDPLAQACAQAPDSVACVESKKGQDATSEESPVTGIVNSVANIIAIATAVISIIVIIVAGISLVFSAGESAKVASARDAIIYAVVGIVVVALARSIVVFVVNRL